MKKPECPGNKIMRLLFFFSVLILFFSCATVPRFSMQEEGQEFTILPGGGFVYFWVDIGSGRSLVENIFFNGDSRDIDDILNRTNSAAAVVFGPNEGSQRSFFLAAFGSYPRSMANFSFSFSRDWRTQRSSTGSRYWHSRSSSLSLALARNMVLVSDHDPFDVSLRNDSVPPGFLDFRRDKALAGWINDPLEFFDSLMDSMEIPIRIPAEELYFGLISLPNAHDDETEKLWEMTMHIRVGSDRDARTFQGLLNIAMLFFRPAPGMDMSTQLLLSLLMANPIQQNEEFLILRSPPMNVAALSLLFGIFSISSSNISIY